MRQASDGDRPTAGGELFEEAHRLSYFVPRGRAVRARVVWTVGVRRNDVPEQDVGLELELRERSVDDRRRRLGRAGAGELALRREWNPAETRTAVAGRFADEQVPSVRPARQVSAQPLAAELRVGVLVERRADAGERELVDEPALVQALPLR
jgi:hypothetical protein